MNDCGRGLPAESGHRMETGRETRGSERAASAPIGRRADLDQVRARCYVIESADGSHWRSLTRWLARVLSRSVAARIPQLRFLGARQLELVQNDPIWAPGSGSIGRANEPRAWPLDQWLLGRCGRRLICDVAAKQQQQA